MLEIKKNNTTVELRNLQEQVQKNKEDIAKHYEIDRVLANVGMRIIGILPTPEDLPDPLTYTGNYGDTYAVGYDSPYEYYIFTKADANAGYLQDHWLDIGPLTIQGAQGIPGPRGEIGPQGTPGTKWREGSVAPSKLVTDREGDLYLNVSTGDVYKFSNLNWSIIGSIKGPQGIRGLQGPQGIQGEIGPQGPQGEKGDAAGYISIAGILNNSTLLPSPSSINNLSSAYLVGEATPYDLYIQVGDNSDNAVWQNVGPFNIGTVVTVNGEVQNTWEANTKLDKLSFGGGSQNQVFAYGQYYSRFDPQERQIAMPVQFYEDRPYVGHIPTYSTSDQNITEMRGDGYLYVKNPISDFQAANKVYVDSTIQTAIENIEVPIPTDVYVVKEKNVIPENAGHTALYGFSWDLEGVPNDSTYLITDSPTPSAITRFGENATLQTSNPINSLDCVNKQYADGTYLTKNTDPSLYRKAYIKNTNGSQDLLNIYYDGYLITDEYLDEREKSYFKKSSGGIQNQNKKELVGLTTAKDSSGKYVSTQTFFSIPIDPSNISSGNIPTYYSSSQRTSADPGEVLISGTPKADYHVATKKYVDSKTSGISNPHLYQHNLELTSSTLGIRITMTIYNTTSSKFTTSTWETYVANNTNSYSNYMVSMTGFISTGGSLTNSGLIIGAYSENDGTVTIISTPDIPPSSFGITPNRITTSNLTITDYVTQIF